MEPFACYSAFVKRSKQTVILAFAFTLTILGVGFAAFGFVTTLIFTSGFLGGFILWLLIPSKAAYASIRIPYFVVLFLFLLHRVEEKLLGFFAELSRITGVSTPAISSWPVVVLVTMSVGGWLLIPLLIKRRIEFGYYLAWTYFAAMGLTELAHFIFPFFSGREYAYFPGMLSVCALAPAAWWGMWRLSNFGKQ